MSNIEIKKAIKEAIKKVDRFKIKLILWFGDGTHHPELKENEIVIYNCIEIYNNENDCIYSISYGTDEATTKIINVMKAEQKKMYNYLKHHFDNVTMEEAKI